jgi:PiT family inorganic phosphate transporter
MIGWTRIVATVDEKIGQTHPTYIHGASAERAAMAAIAAADQFGSPVSTPHALSSCVAGGTAANGSAAPIALARDLAPWRGSSPRPARSHYRAVIGGL